MIFYSFSRKTKLRSEVERDGDWHKSFHIWIVNKNLDILLQKRSPTKDSHPDMWDISCAGHLSAGDTSLEGALRELSEELGISIDEHELQFLGSLKKQSNYTVTFIDNEFQDIYLLQMDLDTVTISFQKDEITAMQYVPLAEFKLMIENKDKNLLMHPEEFELLFAALDRMR